MKKLLFLLLFPLLGFGQFNPIFFGSNVQKPFVSTWNTNNTSVGSSTSTQVSLPLIASGTYNFSVDWGDGTYGQVTTYNIGNTHTYSIAGTYVIKIYGVCIGWQFNNSGDRLKILDIYSWGKLRLGNSLGYFNGCANLNLSNVIDVLNLTGTTILSNAFQGCSGMTTCNRMNEWNVSNVTLLNNIFQNCSNFDQNIGNWNVSSVVDFSRMFAQAIKFNNGGSSDINNWNLKTTGTVDMNTMFANANLFNQPLNNWNTIAVVNMLSMFQNATVFNQDIGSWNISNVANLSSFMLGKTPATFSTANLDSIYNGWSTRTVQPSITITFGTAKYTAGAITGRAILTGAPNLWNITDGGI